MGKINLNKVTKSFVNNEVIPPLDLAINDSDFVVFVGPSGCGKSTLLRLIAGLEDVTSGTIKIDDKEVTRLAPASRGLAMVFQSYALYPHMSVRRNISFPLKMAGLNRAEVDKKVEYAAKILNLTDYLDYRPGQLSGGQRQRVAIGRAIVREPAAFLFDEPLSNLDAALRVNMRSEITDLHRQLKTTMIYVTHDQIEAMTMADTIVVLRDGKIEQTGSPMDLYRSPRNRFVAGFIGSPKMNFLPAKTSDAHEIGVRPEHLSTVNKDGDFTGKVLATESLGADTYLRVGLSIGNEIIVRAAGDVATKYGDEIEVKISGPVYQFARSGKTI